MNKRPSSQLRNSGVSKALSLSHSLKLTVFLFLAITAGHVCAAEEEAPRRPWDGKPGFCRFPGTISPDGSHLFVWAPDDLSAEDLAKLPEWPRDQDINSDQTDVANYLYDTVHKRIVAKLPGLDFFAGQGCRKNRGAFHVAWTADSRSALIICEQRWDDEGILWVDAQSGRTTDLKYAMEQALIRVLNKREKDETGEVNIQFNEPAILPGNRIVVDGNAGHFKEGPYYHYRLTLRLSLSGDKPSLETVKTRMISEEEERTTSGDYDSDLNTYYTRLRSELDEKGRAALTKEELEWIKFRDAQPEVAREQLTERRAMELRASVEN